MLVFLSLTCATVPVENQVRCRHATTELFEDLRGSGMKYDPYAHREPPKPLATNATIIIIGLAVLGTLSGVFMMTLGYDAFSDRLEEQREIAAEVIEEEKVEPPTKQSVRYQGYAFDLPIGYQVVSEQTEDDGTVVVRYSGEDGCHFIFALLRREEWDRFTSPPSVYDDAIEPEIKGLDHALGTELLAQKVGAGGMPASFFQFYERETFRGIDFTYLLVAMHRGEKVMLKFGGKYNRLKEDVEFVEMPEHWRDCLLTLRPLLPGEQDQE